MDSKKLARRIKTHIEDMPPESAREIVETIADLERRVHGLTARTWVMAITGGYYSQSISFAVMRRLGIRAGMILNPKMEIF